MIHSSLIDAIIKRICLLISVIPLVIIVLWTDVAAQQETQKAKLEQLSQVFARQLEERRTQLYRDLLESTEPAQRQLNENPNIELMYIKDRGMPVYYLVGNLDAARTISTDDVWPGGIGGFSLSGLGTDVGRLGIWDGGAVRATHQELTGRVVQIDSPGSTHYHATHVAGTMIASGVQSAARGMSYEANLTAYDWNNDNSEMSSAAASGMNVSNHSYGYVTGWYFSGSWYWYGDISISTTEDYGFGFYGPEAAAWDDIAYNAPYYTIVKSAGNDRNDYGPGPGGGHYVWDGGWVWSTDTRDPDGGTDGYDCVSYNGNAKNIITVGAADDIPGGYSVPADVVMSAFSGWGPTDDGRIKPDLMANGISLYSTMDDSDNAYDYLNGTSMSSPNLSGSLNLLVRHYEDTHSGITPRSATTKAVLIQSADEAGPYPGPDYMFGWGLMNTLKAAELISADSLVPGTILEDSLADIEADEFFITSDGLEPIRVTLAWTDPAGTSPPPSLNPATLMLVHDMDLRLEHIGSSTTYMPYILNPSAPDNAATSGDNILDNVEQVYIDAPPAGTYRVTVSHKGNLGSTQYYSLASSIPIESSIQNNPPVALCQDITVDADASCSATVSVDNGSYDPDGDSITLVQIPDSPYPLGQTVVSLIVTDTGGLADTCQALVDVVDNTPPVAICPTDMIVENDPGQCGAVVVFTPGGSDNCSGVTLSADPPSGSFFSVGTTQVEVIATDASGNADTCSFDVTVDDTEPPVASCPADMTVDGDPVECTAVVSFTVGGTDNCAGVTVSANPPSGSSFPVGVNQVEVIAIDVAGNADTCYFNVTVNDTVPPVVNCPDDTTVSNDPGQCYATVTYTVNATDNCSGVTISFDPPSGSLFPIGATQVEVIATDASGNADTCYFNVSVIDSEFPVAICSPDIFVSNDPGQCGAAVAFTPGGSDNCSGVTISADPPPGSFFPIGITTVEVIATDASGNADTCYFDVSVIDDEAPVAACPADMIVDNDPGQCGAVVVFTPSGSDNCSGVTVSANPPPNSFFPVGITQVEVIATDSSGNADTCYFDITVNDVELPVVVCPADTTVDGDPVACNAIVSFTVGATDNCAGVIVSANPPSGSPFPVGTTPVEVIATDVAGNADTCYFNVTVTDTVPPTVNCPGDTTAGNDPGQCGAVVEFTPDASDNCSGMTVSIDPPSGSFFSIGTTQVEVIATDAAGNADTCYFNVSVTDDEIPVAGCPADMIVDNDPGQCGAVASFPLSISDNCSGGTISSNPPSGSFFPVGMTQVEVIAADASGNADTCYFNITVNDIEQPVAICPADTTVTGDPVDCAAVVSFTVDGTDNCGVVASTANPPSGTSFPVGTTQVEVIATDAAGNADSCYFNVTVNDTVPPIVNCPADTTISNGPGQCGASVVFTADASDNCSDATVVANPPSGSFFPVGTTQVEVIATDLSGNADTCYFNITVIDTEPPSVSCPADTSVSNDPGQCGAVVVFTPWASDNCSGLTGTADPPSGSFFPVGATQVEVIATDASGNADTCYFNINVNDVEPPVAICPSDIALVNDPGICGAVVSFEIDGVDNCPDVTVVADRPSGSIFEVGSTIVNVIAADASGNIDSCYFIISVYDNEPPIAVCPGDTIASNDSGYCGAIVNFTPDAIDNCPWLMIDAYPPSGSFFDLGTTQVEVTVNDAFGYADTCYFDVTVVDDEPPVTDYPDDIIVGNDPTQCGAVVTYTVSATDNCGFVTVVSSPPSGSFFPVGTTQVEVIAVDAYGNSDTSFFNIIVNDEEPPVAICPADTTVAGDPVECMAVVSFAVDATDNCAGVTVTANPPSGSSFPVGVNQVEVVATDAAGNADTCYFNVIVTDAVPPTVSCPGDTTLSNDPGQCGAVVEFSPIASDNCSGVTVSTNPQSGSLFPVGETQVEVVAIDASGNADTCYFFVNVYDNESPVAICPDNMNYGNDAGQCGAIVNFEVAATDNCPDSLLEADPPSGSFFNLGTTQVEVIASDPSGNADTCYFEVTIEDTEPPVALCPPDTVVIIDSSQTGTYVEFVLNATDNCAGATVASAPPSGSWFSLGTTTVEVVATDAAGLEDTCYFDIEVIYDPGPVTDCVYVPGDCDHNGLPLELGDVIAMIGIYRGSIVAPYECSCPPHGENFTPTADPNGNCVAFELGDVVTEIGAYRGSTTAIGCIDCPGSLRLLPEGREQPVIPSLKSKIKSNERMTEE